MRGALLTFGVTVAALLVGVVLVTQTSVFADEDRQELDWIEELGLWTATSSRPPACAQDLARVVGEPPTDRLTPVYDAARDGCRNWSTVVWEIEGSLIDAHREDATTTFEPELSRVAAGIAGRQARTHCWEVGDWEALSEQYAAFGTVEFWLAGLASPMGGRIDLSPVVCDGVRPFFADRRLPSLISFEAYELAEALVVLAHEAEHLRTPGASEPEVECHAMQRVRELVRAEGHGPQLQNELALLAWDIGYPENLEEYRTDACADGGPLDLHPGSSAWP
jgi:hypothetical protein